MTQEEIIEGNKLIAKFMGWRFDIIEDTCHAFYEDNLMWTDSVRHLDWLLVSEHGFAYHFDWNMLMPVIDKINIGLCEDCLGYVDIKATEISPYSSGCLSRKLSAFYYVENGRRFNGDEKRQAVWRAILEFIKWYNTQPHQSNK